MVATAALVLAACTEGGERSADGGTDRQVTETSTVGPHGQWRVLAEPPLSVAPRAPSVWTGEQLIIWGGTSAKGEVLASGAAYDSGTDKWSDLPPAPGVARDGHSAVWTGAEVLYWGGQGPDPTSAITVGLAYNPATKRWRELPEAPIPAAVGANAVWVDFASKMVVWACHPPTVPAESGCEAGVGTFDPETNTWTRLPGPPTGSGGPPVAVLGSTVLVLRQDISSDSGLTAQLVPFDVRTGTWGSPGEPSPPEPKGPPWQAVSGACSPPSKVPAARVAAWAFIWTGTCGGHHGLAYDRNTDAWTRSVDLPRMQAVQAVAGENEIYLFGEVPTGVDVYQYGLGENVLVHLAHPGVDVVPGSHGVWTGEELLLFNGTRGIDQPRPGAAFRPPARPRDLP